MKCCEIQIKKQKYSFMEKHLKMLPEFYGFRVWGKIVFWMLELMATLINLANQVKVGHTLDQPCKSCGLEGSYQNNEPSWQSSRTIADFPGCFEWIKLQYLLYNCGTKIKTHFGWVLFDTDLHSLGLMGRKVLTDLVKISVKGPMHMGLYYIM